MLTTSVVETPTLTRTARLRAHTNPLHERLDTRIMACRPFEDRKRYGLFLRVQHPFMQQVESAYRDASINALIPGLSDRARLVLIEQDLADLALSPTSEAHDRQSLALPEALGWLYVAEGSNLGAAFLLKMALKLGLSETFGARHLAGHPEGRGLSWRRFTDDFNAIALSDAEEERADRAAADAFRFVQMRVDTVFA